MDDPVILPTVSATRNRLAELMTSIGQGAGKAVDWLAGGAHAGTEPTLALMRGDALGEPFLPTATSGGRLGAIASALGSTVMPAAAPAGALGAGPVLRTANTALDLSPEARAARAAEMGYTVDAFHGTNADFHAFDPARTGDIGLHFGTAEQADKALQPLGRYDAGANVLPVKLKIENPLRVKDQFSTLGATFQNRAKTWHLGTPGFRMSWDEQAALYDAAKAADKARKKGGGDWGLHMPGNEAVRASYEDASRRFWQAVQDSATRQGYDGLVYNNKVEGKGDSYVAFDPSQARSRFAAFDPQRSGESDLLASRAGAPAVPPQPQPEDPATAAARAAWIQQHLARGGM